MNYNRFNLCIEAPGRTDCLHRELINRFINCCGHHRVTTFSLFFLDSVDDTLFSFTKVLTWCYLDLFSFNVENGVEQCNTLKSVEGWGCAYFLASAVRGCP